MRKTSSLQQTALCKIRKNRWYSATPILVRIDACDFDEAWRPDDKIATSCRSRIQLALDLEIVIMILFKRNFVAVLPQQIDVPRHETGFDGFGPSVEETA